MLKIFAWLIVIYIVWEYVFPFIKVCYIKLGTKRTLQKLNKSQYKVLKNIKLPSYSMRKKTDWSELDFFAKGTKTVTIDYLVISGAGIIAINILNLKHHFRGLRGNEHHEKWEVIRFSRIWLPFVDLNSYRKICNPLSKTKENMGMLKHILQISDNIPFFPVVMIVPKIRGVDLRERQSNSWVIFPKSLESTIKSMKPDVISKETIEQIYDQISMLQMQINIGLR